MGIVALAALLAVLPAAAIAETGIASLYSDPQPVACGGRLNAAALTAAHRSLPCGTKVLVTNRRNGLSVVVTINDRGPFVRKRIIDLTPSGARTIRMAGLAEVSVILAGDSATFDDRFGATFYRGVRSSAETDRDADIQAAPRTERRKIRRRHYRRRR